MPLSVDGARSLRGNASRDREQYNHEYAAVGRGRGRYYHGGAQGSRGGQCPDADGRHCLKKVGDEVEQRECLKSGHGSEDCQLAY